MSSAARFLIFSISAIFSLTSRSVMRLSFPGRNSSDSSEATAAILTSPRLRHTPFMAWALSKTAVPSSVSPAALSAAKTAFSGTFLMCLSMSFSILRTEIA